MKPLLTSLFTLVLLAGAGWMGFSPDACAQASSIANQTCDTQVWQTMEARARIETEREIMQNQNLIFKPDSILNYVCFDSLAGHAAANVGVLFTHTTYWDGKLIIEWGDQGKYKGVDEAVNKAVIESLKTYLKGNYDHSLLGGRGQVLGLGATPAEPKKANQSSTYSCGVMAQVWATAKCLNFLHTNEFAKTDGYYPFLNLKAEEGGENVAGYESINEVRNFPNPCGGTPITGSTWKDMYHLSRNETGFGAVDAKYQFGTPLNKAFTDVRKLLEPGKCESPIKTGVKVIKGLDGSTPYDDGVCTNPGCAYDGSSCKPAGS
ncbi:MAG: hypothetical protein WC989_03565 [Micavibrio sp.]